MNRTNSAERTQSRTGHFLRAAMVANAAFSGLSGWAMALASPALEDILGLDRRVVLVIGLGLVGYAALLLFASRRARILRNAGRIAVAADLLWVMIATVVVGFGEILTGRGNVILALVTAGVAVLAGAQWLGLRRLAAATDELPQTIPTRS